MNCHKNSPAIVTLQKDIADVVTNLNNQLDNIKSVADKAVYEKTTATLLFISQLTLSPDNKYWKTASPVCRPTTQQLDRFHAFKNNEKTYNDIICKLSERIEPFIDPESTSIGSVVEVANLLTYTLSIAQNNEIVL